MGGEEELKVGMMTKRAQQKKSIGPTNYKERLFVLSRSKLQYYEGNKKHRGRLKGSIAIQDIKFVGIIEDEALSRTSAFQIMHNGYYLYCCAKDHADRVQWIDAITQACQESYCNLEKRYHPRIYAAGKWQCCGHSDKNSPGCKEAQSPRRDATLPHNKASLGGVASYREPTTALPDVPPQPPPRIQSQAPKVEIDVVALFDFAPQEPDDLPMYQGECYTVIDDSKQHWWKAKDRDGQEGFVPSNYVKERTDDDIESKDWYQMNLSRHEAEECLLEDAGEGAFLVRSSTHRDVMYTLSLVSKSGQVTANAAVKHYHIKQNKNGQYYFSEKYAHDSILDLIYYHQYNAGGLVTRLRQAPARYRTAPPAVDMFRNTQWEIDMSQLQLDRDLGNGQFGVVKLALFRNQQWVAVKMMREGTMEEDSFIEEANVMTKLSHRNLVRLYGVVTRQRPICIVTEYMENGCLLDYIRNYFTTLQAQGPLELLNMCYQVCDAMSYLEEMQLIHRDLAARNCLVGKNGTIKVSDFGLTRFVIDDEYTSSFGSKFPIKWAAPEVLNYTKFSSKSDVWAFGVLMWEVYSGGKMPYRGMQNSDVVEDVTTGHRLERPSHCPHDVYHIMRRTWELEPGNRPSFYQLMHSFYDLTEKMNNDLLSREY